MGSGLSMASVNKIKELAAQREYSLALDIIDSQDLSKSLNPQFLRLCGEVFIKSKRYVDARKTLLMARKLTPAAKRIIFSLEDLYMRMGYKSLVDKYYELYMFDADAESEETKQLNYLYDKYCGKPLKDLESYLIPYYVDNMDYDWSFEAFLLLSLEDKEDVDDAVMRALVDEYLATYKNSKNCRIIASIKDDGGIADSLFYNFNKSIKEDDDPKQEKLRKEEIKLFEADELRIHPKEAEIIEIIDEDEDEENDSSDDKDKKKSGFLKKLFVKNKNKEETSDKEEKSEVESETQHEVEKAESEAEPEVESEPESEVESEPESETEPEIPNDEDLEMRKNIDDININMEDFSDEDLSDFSDNSVDDDFAAESDTIEELHLKENASTVENIDDRQEDAVKKSNVLFEAVDISVGDDEESYDVDDFSTAAANDEFGSMDITAEDESDLNPEAEEVIEEEPEIAEVIEEELEAEESVEEEAESEEVIEEEPEAEEAVEEAVEPEEVIEAEPEAEEVVIEVIEEEAEPEEVIEEEPEAEKAVEEVVEEEAEPEEVIEEEPEAEESVEEAEPEEVIEEEPEAEEAVEEVVEEEAEPEEVIEEEPEAEKVVEEAEPEPQVEEEYEEEDLSELFRIERDKIKNQNKEKKLDFPVFRSSLFPDYHNDKPEIENNFNEIMSDSQSKITENFEKEAKLQKETEALLASLGIDIGGSKSSSGGKSSVYNNMGENEKTESSVSRKELKNSLKIGEDKKIILRKMKEYR